MTGGFGGFGATTQPSTTGFGASTTSTFGAPATTGGLFGQPNQPTGNMFGASSAPSMFGAPATPATTASPFGSTGSSFGSSNIFFTIPFSLFSQVSALPKAHTVPPP
jgi:nuclear pore complex protein Nup98-Nup96